MSEAVNRSSRGWVYGVALFMLLLLPVVPALLMGLELGLGESPRSFESFLSVTVLSAGRWIGSALVLVLIFLGGRAKKLPAWQWAPLSVAALVVYVVAQWLSVSIGQGDWTLFSGNEMVNWLFLMFVVDFMTLHGPTAAVICAVSIYFLRRRKTVSPRYGTSYSVQ